MRLTLYLLKYIRQLPNAPHFCLESLRNIPEKFAVSGLTEDIPFVKKKDRRLFFITHFITDTAQLNIFLNGIPPILTSKKLYLLDNPNQMSPLTGV